MADVTRPEVFFDAGRIIGLLVRHSAADYRRASVNPDLAPPFQVHLRLLARMRDQLDGPDPAEESLPTTILTQPPNRERAERVLRATEPR